MAVLQHETTISDLAEQISRELSGHRVEIILGRLTVTPPADGAHALTLSWLSEDFGKEARAAGLRLVQAVGLWLPSGPADYSVPGLSVVEADFRDSHRGKNCYAPHVFRMVLEVTSSNWADDLGPKVDCYAQAGIPVYVIADRRNDQVLLYTDPREGKYHTRTPYKRGAALMVPASVGIDGMELSVDRLLDGDD